MEIKKKAFFVYFFTLGGIIIWLGMIFLAPYLKNKSSGLNVLIYTIFSPICHQIPSRSFCLFKYPLAVCARCLGIYFGFLAGAGFYPFSKRISTFTLPKTRTFILISLPIVFDTLGNFFQLWTTANWFRFSTGFLWGIILPYYLIVGLTDLFIRTTQKKF